MQKACNSLSYTLSIWWYILIPLCAYFTSSNIKCIDNQYITFIKVQIICKCMHKTTYTKYKRTLFIRTSFYFLCTKSQYIVIMLAFSILRIYFLIFDDNYQKNLNCFQFLLLHAKITICSEKKKEFGQHFLMGIYTVYFRLAYI